MALTKNKTRTEVNIGQHFDDPVAAGAIVYQGALVSLDGDGNAIAATGAETITRGVALEGVDNTGGADGDTTLRVKRGVFIFASDGSIDRTHIGLDVFVIDDDTVGAAGTQIAGKCSDVLAEGVAVTIL